VLVLLLRGLLAPVLLVLTVIASFLASLGAAWLLFDHVLGYPALDSGVLLLAFVFLVALGVDYNIFLVTRAREDARRSGTRDGRRRTPRRGLRRPRRTAADHPHPDRRHRLHRRTARHPAGTDRPGTGTGVPSRGPLLVARPHPPGNRSRLQGPGAGGRPGTDRRDQRYLNTVGGNTVAMAAAQAPDVIVTQQLTANAAHVGVERQDCSARAMFR
jgi:hypothetical protein